MAADEIDSLGPIEGLQRIARDVADDVGLLYVEDIQKLAMIVYVAVLNGPPERQPIAQVIAQKLRRQLVIWAWEEGQNGGTLPFAEESQAGSDHQAVRRIKEKA